MTKLAPEWVRTSDPVIRSPARYRWTTAPAVLLFLIIGFVTFYLMLIVILVVPIAVCSLHSVVNTKRMEPSFFVTKTAGDAQGLSLGSICPLSNISLIHSCSVQRLVGARRRGPHLTGRAPLVSISCRTASVHSVTGSPGAGKT